MAKYDESSVSYFSSDLQKIRAKPAMYIGPVDASGIFTIIREPADNAVDEARAGRNKLIHIYVNKDGSFIVLDQGVGIPVKLHPKAKISTFTHVLTNLQSSGKMSGDAYKAAIGTHGVGLKATNALSSSMEAFTYRKDSGGWHGTSFEGGKERSRVKKCRPPELPDGSRPKLGTVIRFTPDNKIFGKSTKLDISQLRLWCEVTAYMNAGLTIKLTNEKGKTNTWFSKKGITEYLQKRISDLKATQIGSKIVEYHSGTIELALAFTDTEGCETQFYTNTIRNVDGGFHADNFFKALKDSLKEYTSKKQEYTVSDLKEGLVGIFNYKVDAPQFSSQTKDKLVDTRISKPCYDESLKLLKDFWAKNKSLAKQIVINAVMIRSKTQDFLKDKKLIRNVNGAKKNLATKLAGISGKTPIEKRELFLVEGDSAAGTAKRARFKDFQAVYPLRGKPLNVMEAKKEKVNANAELANILAAIGVDLSGKKHDIGYGKIIFLTDPDVDGRHINCLLLAFFWKYMPYLFKDGRIYVLRSPEYNAWHRGQVYFGMTKESVYKQAGTQKLDIQHIKGWGEIQDVDMQPIAFDPDVRRLYRVLPPKDKQGKINFEALMGNDATYRKSLLGVD